MRARLITVAVLLACGGSDPSGPVVADRISVSPSNVLLESIGDTVVLSAQAIASDGTVLPGVTITYASSSSSVATVDASGRVVAVSNGSAFVTVAAGSANATVTVRVAQRATSLVSAPSSLSFLSSGDTARIVASARDARGNAIPGITATWTSSNPSVATVSGGLVTAVADGTTEIVAGFESLSTSTPVTVSRRLSELRLPGDTLVMDALGVTATSTVVARDANGRDMPGLALTWESSDTTVVRVSASGTLTSVSNGDATLRVRNGTLVGSRAVRVRQRAASLEFGTPPAALIVEGESVGSFTVVARDRNAIPLQVVEQVSISLVAPPPNAGKLGGNTGPRPIAGEAATFSGVTIDRSGPGYRVVANIGSVQVMSGPIDVALKLVSIDSYFDIFCARDVRADMWCWGINVPPVALGSIVATPVPQRVGNVAFNTVISFGDGRQCGIAYGNTTRCWGNQWGPAPPSTASVQSRLVSAVSDSLYCGLSGSGNAWCFGPSALGTRGTGFDVLYHPDSATVTANNHTFTSLSVSYNSTCGINANAELHCWGWNQLGQLGIPNTGSGYINTPTKLGPVGISYATVQISGGSYACGLTTLGRLFCWGSNAESQFGFDGTVTPHVETPFFIPSNETFTQINVGDRHGCGLNTFGQAFCWGTNRNGYLGRGTSSGISITPNPVITNERFIDIAGRQAICGLTARGLVFCWGVFMTDDGRFTATGQPRTLPIGTVVRANTVVP